MHDKDFLKEIVSRAGKADEGYFQYAHIIAVSLPKEFKAQLDQLVGGPVFDGDVIAKSHRDWLLDVGLAVRVCLKGEQGFTGATYLAATVNKTIHEIKSGKLAP